MVTNTKIEVNGTPVSDVLICSVIKAMSENNSISSFYLKLDTPYGRHSTDFEIEDTIDIYADLNAPATTKIFSGLIERIVSDGEGNTTTLTIEGRDFGGSLIDIMVQPRIFSSQEASVILKQLMTQNANGLITTNNVDTTTTNIPKITFSNISLFDALAQIAKIAGYYFYVDEDKDLHFHEKESISSGETLDNTNTLSAIFKTNDDELYTKVTVQGTRQLTGAQEIFTVGTDNTGSVFELTDQPTNTVLNLSGATNTLIQPGGVINLTNPATDNAKYLVDFQGRKVILTSGTASGDNVLPNGSVLIIDYQRSTPLIAVRENAATYPKHRIVTDRNIQDINEASLKAQTILDENSTPKTNGKLEVKGLIGIEVGTTVDVDFPQQGQASKTYGVNQVRYDFNKVNQLNDSTMSLSVNKKIRNFADIFKEQVLRLRALESAETGQPITTLQTGSSVVGVVHTNQIISHSIGSAFYFNVPGHDELNSPKSLLGDIIGGSIVFENGVQI